MKVAIAGGSGFIGKHLTEYYIRRKTNVVLISRSRRASSDPLVENVTWEELESDVSRLDGTEAIINLAGESINQRWSDAAKRRILDSRLEACARVREIVRRLPVKPVLINATGMSIYGTSLTETYTESSPHVIQDFLAEVVEAWEKAVMEIPASRIVMLRLGVVLGNDGGAYPKMRMPFLFGAGGRVGSGRQWLSWIHIEDMVRLIDYCLEHEDIEGPVNATAPEPVTNDGFGRTLAKMLGRPYWFPVPAFVMRLVFGEMADLLLEGQKVLPQKAQEHGFSFNYPTLDKALEQLVRSAKHT